MSKRKLLALCTSTLLLAGLASTALASDNSSDIEKQIAQTKKEYFSLYNRLNSDPAYDVVCRGGVEEGRICWPRFREMEWLQLRRHCKDWCFTYLGPNFGAAPPSDRGFRRNANAVLQRSPELRALGVKLEDLQARAGTGL